MNRELYEYCLGSKKRPRTDRGKAIHRLISDALRSGSPSDAELLRLLLVTLAGSPTLDDDVFRLLKPLHGCGGSEGYVLQVEPTIEAEFWGSLARQFPNHQGVLYKAADSALLAGDMEAAGRWFVQGFRLAPDTLPPEAVDWDEVLAGTEWQFEYRLHSLARTHRDAPEEVSEEVAELIGQYGNDPDKLKAIRDVANGGAVPTFG